MLVLRLVLVFRLLLGMGDCGGEGLREGVTGKVRFCFKFSGKT